MKLTTLGSSRERTALVRLFTRRLSDMKKSLHELSHLQVDHSKLTKLTKFHQTWDRCCARSAQIEPARSHEYVACLARLAEACADYARAKEVLRHLADAAFQIENASAADALLSVDILAQCAEMSRRCGDVGSGKDELDRALANLKKIEERAINERIDDTWIFCRKRGRLLYEQAYLHRCCGQIDEARLALELSAKACEDGRDPIGASIARIIRGLALLEDGVPDEPRMVFLSEQRNLGKLCEDVTIPGDRRNFGNRFSRSVTLHLAQAYIADGKLDEAHLALDPIIELDDDKQSPFAWANVHRVDAQLCVAEGRTGDALKAVEKSQDSLNKISSVGALLEASALTKALAGFLFALQGDTSRANNCYHAVWSLPIQSRNHLGVGWAAAGEAVLIAKSGNCQNAIAVVTRGLDAIGCASRSIRSVLLLFLQQLKAKGHLDEKDANRLLSLIVTGANLQRCQEVFEHDKIS